MRMVTNRHDELGSVNGPRSTSEAARGWVRVWAVVRDQASVKEETEEWRDRRPGMGTGADAGGRGGDDSIDSFPSFLPPFRPSVSWQRSSVLIPIKALLCPLLD